MERITRFTPAYDRRDPDPSKNYGIHCAELRMELKGKRGATQFVLYTGWHLPNVTRELGCKNSAYSLLRPIPADLGYHSPKPIYDGHEPICESCKLLDGKPCYYDGSGLNAECVFDILVKEGGDGVWQELEEYYINLFGELE